MKTLIKLFISIVLIMGMTFQAFAQAPGGFNYQAVVRDASGGLITNSPITVKLEVREDTPGGTIIYDETHTLNTNDYGLFSVVAGEGTPGTGGSLNAVDWEDNDHFLKVLVNTGSGQMDMGTTQLMSVPYSFAANTAGKATDMDLEELTDVSTTNPANGQVLKWNGTQWAPAADNAGGSAVWNQSGSTISYSGGNVGLGTAAPAHPFHVVADPTAANMVSIETSATPAANRDVLELKVDAATGDNAQFIEMERGIDIVAAINTDGSAKFKSVEFEDGTVQETAAFGPIAYGFIQTAATTSSGSGNYTVTWNASNNRYEITIAGESYFWTNYTTVITPIGTSVKSFSTSSVSGNLLVYLYDSSGNSIQDNFQFVTFK